MSHAHSPKPHHPNHDVPEEFEPGTPPVEPDQGPVLPLVPDDPGANRAWQAQRTRRQAEIARCL